MRAASPPWQLERENEMIVISHRFFDWRIGDPPEPSKAVSHDHHFPPKLYKLKLKVMTPSLYDTARLPFMSLAMSRAMARPMP